MIKNLCIETLLFFCGSATGSFLNCVCDRMIQKESILGRSRCPKCSRVIDAIDLIPVFSYLYLKGRCRRCGEKINPFCVWAEIIAGALYVLIYCRFGFCIEMFLYLLIAGVLLMISLSDAKSMLIPDAAMYMLLLFRILFIYLTKEETEMFLTRLSGSILLAIFLCTFIYFSERVTGKEMMGKGDVVLIFLLGSFMCIQEDLLALLLSSSIAMIYGIPLIKKKQLRCFPFAPAICLAYLMMLLYDTQIMRFYLSLFQK